MIGVAVVHVGPRRDRPALRLSLRAEARTRNTYMISIIVVHVIPRRERRLTRVRSWSSEFGHGPGLLPMHFL
jgi:hypothetical protein